MAVSQVIRRVLPPGTQLSDEVWATRHRLIVSAWLFLMPVLVTVGLANGTTVTHLAADLSLAFMLPGVVVVATRSRGLRACAMSFGLMAAAGQLVHLTSGLIEAHFLFFVLLPLVALYQDWRPFVVAVAYVVISHAVVGVLAPHDVYNHDAAIANPVLWALIHASFVVGLVVVLGFYWHWMARERSDLATALDDLRRTQNELLQAQKLESVGQLAAGVAHEINTPIQFVGDNIRFLHDGFAELFALVEHQAEIIGRGASSATPPVDAADESEVEFLVQEVPQAISQSLDGIERIAEIVRALKGVAHPGGDSFRPTDLNKLMSDTLLVSRSEWKYVAEAETDFDPALGLVDCAPGPLNQVLLNMIVNAAHAIEDRFGTDGPVQGRITLTSRLLGDRVELRIGDNGAGMSPSVRAKIFDPFFTTKAMGRGTGQGLAISHSVIVARHGGTIEVESEVGAGTAFVLQLPIAQAAPVS